MEGDGFKKQKSVFLKREYNIDGQTARQVEGWVGMADRQVDDRQKHTYIHTCTHRTDLEKEKPVKGQYVKGRELEREEMKLKVDH